jgi:chromosome transmission fidelity protein 1
VLPELRKIKLSQVVSVIDLHPSKGSSVPQKRVADVLHDVDSTMTRVVALGSRKQLCINEELRSKARDLDEACRELLSGESLLTVPY